MNQLENKKKWLIIGGIVLASLCVIYLGIGMYLSDKFLPGTTINGVNCFGKTVAEVETELKGIVDGYKLEITDVNGNVEECNATDFEMNYEAAPDVEKLQKAQNSYVWIKGLFQEQTEEIKIQYNFSEEALDQTIAALECMKEENQVAPVSATLAYQDGTFAIVDEIYGTQIDPEVMKAVITESVSNLDAAVNLNEKGCYVQPQYIATSENVLNSQTELNKYLATVVTYSIDSLQLVVDKEKISEWLTVDEDVNPVILEEKVKEFTDTLGDTFNTPNTDQTLTTPTGKQVNVANARKGRIVGSEAECAQLIEDIKNGSVVTRSPILSQEATPEGEYPWGSTYLEVDISAQHMWYIKGGSVAFESDVVTGKPSSATPTGYYQILEKKRDKVLRGDKQPDGSWGYESPVSYWMRVTWSGIGFHDATWQSAFGGSRYVNGYGSHGCINMPLSKARTLYDMISVGTKVIIHK